LYVQVWDSSGTRYAGQWGGIAPGAWTHVAVTWKTNGDLIGYINGEEAGRIPASSHPIGANTNPLRVGITPWSTSQYPVNGLIDHVTLYTRALWPYEVRQLFRFQAKWVEERQSTEITIDADDPTSTLESDETYRPNRDAIQLVSASDPTSYVRTVEVGVSTDGGHSYTWETAPVCEDAPGQGVAWCPTFTPTQGEGRYLLQTRATDIVGHVETPSQTYTFLVDDTPPQPGTAIAQGQILQPQRDPSAETAWLVGLNGTANDPAVAGSPGSGVASVSVKLTDTDPVTDTLQPQSATVNGSAWTADYRLSAADPTGTYTLTAQAADRVGNTSEFATLVTLGVDAAPPEASLDPIPGPYSTTITSTVQLTGQITETGAISIGVAGLRVGILPAAMASLADAVAVFHFDEPAGATRFANDIGTGDATCSGSACPSAGGPGTWGAAVAFSGDFNTSDDYLTADGITAAFSGTAGLSFGGWVYPDYNPGNRAFLAFNTADGGLRNQIVHDDYTLKYMDGEVEVPIGHAWDRWAYVMVTIDADGKGAAYLDGELKAEFTTSIRPDPEGRFSIGQEWDGDTPSQFFNGHVDEVFIFSRALSPAEVRSVYADAGLDASGQGVLSTGWRYIVPGGLDGLYQLNLRPYDVFGNSARRTDWPAWTGEIDTAAPAVALTIAEKSETTDAGGLNVFNTWTTYTCWARDFNLVATSATHPEYDFQCPCDTVAPLSTVISDTFYHQVSPWYAEVFSDTTRLYERTATCRVPGLATDNFMQACDAYGHCASQVADVDQAFEVIPAAYTVVLTPTHQAILTATGSTTIEARAYARDRIKQVEIYDGVALVGAVLVDATCTGNITTTQWTQAWVATDGAHSLTSRVIPCTGDTATSVSNLVRVDSLPPLPPVWPFTLNRQQRLSYGRVALSGQASDAPPGTGVTRVEVSVDGGAWAEASLQGGNWCYEWYLGEEPDNAQYNVAVRASDFAGWSTQAAHAVTVDLDAPNPITLSLTSDVTAGGVVSPGLTLRQIPATLDLTWQASEPPEKLLNYQVLWTVDTPTQTLQIPAVVPPGGPLSSTYQALFDAQRIEPSVTSVFTDGNTQLDDWGPVYVDTPLTPDYIEISGYRPYREWMDSGCSLVGVDRRIAESAQSGAALDSAQNLYVTWDSEALRIAWTGANWDYDGDLFVYLDTLGDPSVPLTAFNPFSNTQQTTLNIPGAKAFIWVQGSQLAQMGYWNGTSFQQTVLNSSQYRFDTGLAGGTTDLYIPFDLLGIIAPAATPLMLYAFATDEGALRLWSTMPPANPVNSNLVVDTGIFAGDDYIFGMIQFYFWPSLGPGICPNTPGGLEPLYVDSDLRFSLSADPVGSTYSFMGDGLFWLQEELMDPNRPADFSESFTFMDVDHPFVSDGATISYTLSYENRGTVAASGVTVTVAALFGLQLVGTSPQSTTIALGDIAPGESGSVTFQGQVDLSATYTPCLTLNPGDPEICEPFRDWAAIEAVVYDNAYGIAGNPLDWLWADHRVDSEPPDSLGILWPESLIGSGINTFSGYAYDPSGVPTLTLEVHSPGTTPCPDDTPQGGVWTCQWDATAANGGIPPDDGDTFNLRLQATDPFEHSSQTDWQTFIVDSVPPTVTFSAETTATYSNTVVNRTTLAFSGQINDNRGVGDVHVCLNDDCTLANVQLEGVPSGVYDDEPATPTAIGACGGGEIGRTFIVTDSFAIGQVSLGFNADHARRNDIQATLESPSGTEVRVLFPKEGSPYAARNYDVLLNDAATSGLHDYKGDDNTAFPYYDRDARPHQPLRAFQGENSAGTWTLTICDTYPADYAGTYNRSRLVLKPQNTAVQTGNWLHTVGGLDNLDNVEQTVQVYGFDLVGNRSTETISLTFWVDNVAPVITVTAAISEVEACPNRTATTVLSGTVSDGGQVSRMYASVRTPGGSRYTGQVARDGDAWWYDLQPDATGTYTIKVTAVDAAGNTASTALYSVQVICVATDLTTALVSAETPVAASTPISLTTRVTNNGGDEVEAGLSVAFYVNGSLIGTAETAQALQAGESEDVTIIWNVDTPGDYELTIIANDDGSGARPLALCSAPGETRQTATILDVPLVKSWNLMSTYVNPFNTDASVVQRPIEGQYVVIQGFDQGAQSYYPDLPPAVNTLKDIDAEHGYWVKVTGTQGNSGELRGTEQAATWRIVGEKFAEDRAIELDAGWNLVSYLPRSPMAVADALQSIDGQYTVVLGYDQGALSYYPDIDPSFNTLQEMEPLFGYWIRMTQEGTLRYPTTGDFRFSIADLRLNALTIENRKSQIANPTNTWVNFYGPAHLPVGTVVQAIDPDGVVCGATVVTTEGQYGLLACYGDDPTTPEDEGARPGDIIQLVVDGQTLGTGVCTVFGDLHWVPLGTASHQWQVFLPLIRVGLPPANYPRR
jgi:subtilisin-like proprotein convertase family protein